MPQLYAAKEGCILLFCPQKVSPEKQAVGSARTNDSSYHKTSESVSPLLESKHKWTLAVWCRRENLQREWDDVEDRSGSELSQERVKMMCVTRHWYVSFQPGQVDARGYVHTIPSKSESLISKAHSHLWAKAKRSHTDTHAHTDLRHG